MNRIAMPALAGAAVMFLIFFGNISMGAAGHTTFLGDVAEMLTLFVSTMLFVVGVLALEAVRKTREADEDSSSGD
ncbi:hypothetical protein LNKW23_43610 [Paralimibaculum aggregatum]|uniref:DUF1328 domain-containing protein n=1 Tax=Paralimibaculum aggregatum TaxID=3036245 RepID=A0ABQ6LSS9_9RHOB|nr:hypothetical protein [Limibaculum sp. NKW23]GMG85145.1 hypothetical protein LNKW23_43610 [Limibaculum sp. NKW23]